MAKKALPYNQAIHILESLKKEYPNNTLGQHIATALGDYGDIWGLTDKEFLFALEKYRAEMEMNIVSDTEVDRVLKEGQNLDKLFQEEEEEDGY